MLTLEKAVCATGHVNLCGRTLGSVTPVTPPGTREDHRRSKGKAHCTDSGHRCHASSTSCITMHHLASLCITMHHDAIVHPHIMHHHASSPIHRSCIIAHHRASSCTIVHRRTSSYIVVHHRESSCIAMHSGRRLVSGFFNLCVHHLHNPRHTQS